jgi:enterochelin esterase family protein
MWRPFVLVLAFLASATNPTFGASQLVTGLEAPSPVLGHSIRYSVYLPANPMPPGERYAVVYLLHGYQGNEVEWFNSGQIAPVLDAAIAAGEIPPLIVVTPAGGNSWYVDNPDRNGSGNMATALTTDFIAAVDSRFPTLACREARIVAGFSMGGTGAVVLGLDHPDLYMGVISLSGRFPPLMAADPAPKLLGRYTGYYAGAFGFPFSPARFNQWNALTKVSQLMTAEHRPWFYLTTGDQDEDDMIEGAARVFDALRATGVGARLRVIGGWHDFVVWKPGLIDALKWMSQILPHSCPS